MLHKIKGVVLHALKYNDNALIVDMYTQEGGRASFWVPVARSRKSTLKSVVFQPLSLVEVEAEVRANVSLHRVKEVKLLHPFQSIPYDPYKSAIALFVAEFLYRAVREEGENRPLFDYLQYAVHWLDTCQKGSANFHLVFLLRLSRFLGFYPNLDDYRRGCLFDLQNACFTTSLTVPPDYLLTATETEQLRQLMRMNYHNMHLFAMSRNERVRLLQLIDRYYRLHLPDFPKLKSQEVLTALFDEI